MFSTQIAGFPRLRDLICQKNSRKFAGGRRLPKDRYREFKYGQRSKTPRNRSERYFSIDKDSPRHCHRPRAAHTGLSRELEGLRMSAQWR
ncbi:hypothetical protein C8R44DRAFT_773610 [Mycena epipterygia]|nr:hypothetical protein C8R44DRAFT_773610 [Mycena epipterygia]